MSDAAGANGNPQQETSAPIVRVVEIVNKKGLHARASAKFVQTAEQYNAAIIVSRGLVVGHDGADRMLGFRPRDTVEQPRAGRFDRKIRRGGFGHRVEID